MQKLKVNPFGFEDNPVRGRVNPPEADKTRA